MLCREPSQGGSRAGAVTCLPGYCPNYWTLALNDETADSLSNSGPPDVSQPRARPGHGMMGFAGWLWTDVHNIRMLPDAVFRNGMD